MSVRFNV